MHTFTITPRPDSAGGGWNLKLLEDGEEQGGGVFPPVEGLDDPEAALLAAYDEAHAEGLDWVNSHAPDGHAAMWPSSPI
jgi:hypothetical protein